MPHLQDHHVDNIVDTNTNSGFNSLDSQQIREKQPISEVMRDTNEYSSFQSLLRTTTINITNIHCSTCVSLISRTLASLRPAPISHRTSLATNCVVVIHETTLSPQQVIKSLIHVGFDVESCTSMRDGTAEEVLPITQSYWLEDIGNSLSRFVEERKRKRHLQQCGSCQTQENSQKKNAKHLSLTSLRSRLSPIFVKRSPLASTSDVESQSSTSTCEDLTSTTTSDLNDIRIDSDSRKGVDIWQSTMSIRGMTCSSCVGSIRRGLKDLPYIQRAEISALTHGGTIIFRGKQNLDKIVEQIDDMGYDVDVIETVPFNEADFQTRERTITLKITGLHCTNCPVRIMSVFEQLSTDQLMILKPLQGQKDPTVKFRYTPQPDINTRIIIEMLKSLDPQFEVTVQRPESLEDRGKAVHKAELRRIAIRLMLSIIVAVPTFIIGIVFMSLLEPNHPLRIWVEVPIWAGVVTRAEWALFVLATPVYFFAADLFHVRAIIELRGLWSKRNPKPIWKKFVKFGSMNLLMSLGTTISYFASLVLLIIDARSPGVRNHNHGNNTTYFDAVVFLTLFLLIGRLLESYSKANSANTIGLLSKLRPSTALLVERSRDEIETELANQANLEPSAKNVQVELLEVGDLVLVPNGQSPPLDGKIITGEAKFDESSLTGESRLISKSIGDSCFAGTVNHGNVVAIEITSISGRSMLDQIVQVVREGQAQRAPIERVADIVTGFFVPVISYLAVITWLVWLSLGYSGALPQEWLDMDEGGWVIWSMSFAIAVFVIACPCGIGLAAPTALFVGTGLAARYGILARGGGEAFQEASWLDCVVFDKTGTLTSGGEPKIEDTDLYVDGDEEEQKVLYSIAETLETISSHPLAQAIVTACRAKPRVRINGENIEEVPGRGIRGKFVYQDKDISAVIGNEAFMTESGVTIDEQIYSTLESWKTEAKSVVLLATSQKCRTASKMSIVAIFSASDPLRPEAPVVVKELLQKGISVYMISGDNPVTAHAVAKRVGILETNVIAGVLPQQKAEKIKLLQQTSPVRARSWVSSFFHRSHTSRPRVAMVGDGINDAPALTVADVGIAIGSGSDIAIGSAGFILLNSNLNQILLLIDLAQTVFHRVKFNFFWAFIYNMIGVPIAAGVLYPYRQTRLDPAWAALAMALSSVSVVVSSLLLKSGVWGVGFRPKSGWKERV